MKVLILGGAGMLGPHVVPQLDQDFDLVVTDIKPLEIDFRGEFRTVDVANPQQVMDAAAGVDAIINLSVLRHDRKLAFDVNTLGCYNMMQAAVAHGIKRIINTGPHFTLAGPTFEYLDYDISPDIPPQPGTNLYALSKSLGYQICKTFTEHHDINVQTYLFYHFRAPDDQPGPRETAPFSVSWYNSAEVFKLGLEIDLNQLASANEAFFVFTDMPHGRFSNKKAKRVLGWQPRNDIEHFWRRSTSVQ
ncbi:MAG: NAD(P)-dependent oxidoreductase [Litorilinea sp.]